MAEGAKLVISDPDIPDKEVAKEGLDTTRPVALVGVSHEHLHSEQNGESKSNKDEEGKNGSGS